jgi:hyperosmotically inducible protein
MMKAVLKVMLQMFLFACLLSLASRTASAQDSTAPAADNTKVNQRDRNKAQPTADQQKESQPDREVARKIRRSIVQDKTLSSDAHNIKVEAKAAEVAGADKVTSQLEVKPKQ